MKHTIRVLSAIVVLSLSCIIVAEVLAVSAQSGTWTTKAPMPTPRSHLGVGEVNGILYAVGGFKARPDPSIDPFVATVEAYDPLTDTWMIKTFMPTPRADLGVGVANGILYAVGGNNLDNFSGMATVEAYDPSTDTWTSKTSMPTARYGLGVVVINGLLYAVGGRGANDLATLEAYDPATDTWTTKAPMPTPRSRLAAGVVNGILYAMGGGDSSSCFATVEAYNPATNTWTSKTPMLIARNYPGAGTVNSVLYAVGGAQNCTGAGTTSEVEAYNSIIDAWTIAPPMPTARFGLGVGVANDVLHAMGGTTNDLGAFAVVEAFTPGTGPPTDKDQCKDGGWQNFDTPRTFKNQGDCVQFIDKGK
jgi:N-acetylneuraminic acid mutarotase